MKHLETCALIESIWYRGSTTKSLTRPYIWLTKNIKMAEIYASLNKSAYGGIDTVKEFDINLKGKNVYDLSMYDMDEEVNESECEDFLRDIDEEYDVTTLFDIMEDKIPLSRLLNSILDNLMLKYDALKVKESGVLTLCINL